MLTIPAAGQRIAHQLEEAERRTNEALAAYASIKQTLLTLRLEGTVPHYEGQEKSLVRLADGEKNLVDAMTSIAKVHSGLRKKFTEVMAIPEVPGRCPATSLDQAKAA